MFNFSIDKKAFRVYSKVTGKLSLSSFGVQLQEFIKEDEFHTLLDALFDFSEVSIFSGSASDLFKPDEILKERGPFILLNKVAIYCTKNSSTDKILSAFIRVDNNSNSLRKVFYSEQKAIEWLSH